MNARSWMRVAIGVLSIAILGAIGWPWVAISIGAASYPTTASGEAANVVIAGPDAYATLADRGFAIFDLATHKQIAIVAPPAGSGSVDDLAVADGLLFVLDARPPGHL